MTAYIWRRGGVDMGGVMATGRSSREAWSMRFESLSVLEMLRDLERQVGEYHRHAAQRAATMAIADRVTLYRTALRVAQQAMQDLGTEPALAHFLKQGTAAGSWPEVQAACVQIAAALAIQIDIEPGRQLSGQSG